LSLLWRKTLDTLKDLRIAKIEKHP